MGEIRLFGKKDGGKKEDEPSKKKQPAQSLPSSQLPQQENDPTKPLPAMDYSATLKNNIFANGEKKGPSKIAGGDSGKVTDLPLISSSHPGATTTPNDDNASFEKSSFPQKPDDFSHGNMDTKVRALVDLVTHESDHIIYPYINYETNKISYPLLERIGESPDNLAFLEKLSSENVGILERQIFERLILCPDHPDNYAVSLRLYCSKCGGIDIEKLHLMEHKACGYIGEKSDFEINSAIKCPSCRNLIKDSARELRISGMWYECNGCSSKFDNPTIKLHCRKYRHDFDMNKAEALVVPLFKLKKNASTAQVSTLSITPMIKKTLAARDFAVEESATLKGKSGVTHAISLYAYNRENKTVLIDIRSSDTVVSDTEVISTFVKVIDICPSVAIFVAIPAVSDRAGAMSSNYSNIVIVPGRNFSEIVAGVDKILSERLGPPATALEPDKTSVVSGNPKRIE